MALHRWAECIGVAALTCALLGCGDVGESSPSSSNAQVGSDSNSRPTIQGQPAATIVVGQTYSFQPAASDANGDRLSFSAANLPQWLTLNASTGRLSGTPTDADIGTYSGLTITASDGTSTATLGPFSITVATIGSGTASLSWMPPSQNIDGSALMDLAGYVVLYGSSPAELYQSVWINNPSISTFIVENLPTGLWYFAVQAVNSQGVRSEASTVASKRIS